ncbi:MAG: polysaccharide deacetylase family protein [Candidatus Pacearchaeota archaeon]
MINFYFKGKNAENKVALTFDDGPSEETEKVLDILKKNNAKGTFFIWGQRIKGREEIIKRAIREGNEIGNHTYSHKNLWFISKEKITQEIKDCDKELEKIGIKTNLFRPPKFRMGINLFKTLKKLNKKLILCDAISNDWRKKGIEYAVKRVLKKTKNGSIVNFHDYIEGVGTNEELIPILERVLSKLKNKYKFITVSELLELQ